MARKKSTRLELRKMAEAAEALGEDGATKKKKTKKKKATRKKATRRAKAKTTTRKRLVWVVYNGSMKEEARFPYDERDAAEEKVKALRDKAAGKSTKMYFIQPVKEALPDAPVVDEEEE